MREGNRSQPAQGIDERGRSRRARSARWPWASKATHDRAMVADILPRTVVLDGGRIIDDRPSTEVLNDSRLLYEQQLEPLSAHGHPHA